MSYKNVIVKKPWGFEYLVYENKEVALWALYIKHKHRTSMHCHPNKTTGLVVLNGNAEVSFLNNSCELDSLNKIMIRKGLFHSTQAISKSGCWIFEIETPVDKNDLVRLKDSYGRQGKPYEDAAWEYPKEDDCIWIVNPSVESSNVYKIANTQLTVFNLQNIKIINELENTKNIMFLEGGITTEYDINVVGAGDIVSVKILKELIKVFTKVKETTVVMIMDENV